MDLKPKTNPDSPPNSLAETTISELFSFVRSDVDRVEQVLVTRYAKLSAEIGPLQEKVELERLTRLQVEDELKKKEEQCQKGKRAQERNEKLLKEAKERELRDKSTIEELRSMNRQLERENLKLKKKWADDRKAVAELRIRVSELEDAKKKNVETIGKLRAENCQLMHLDLGNVYGSVDENGNRKPRTHLQRIKEIRHSFVATENMAPKLGENDLFKHMKKKKAGEAVRTSTPSVVEGSSSETVSGVPFLRKRRRAVESSSGPNIGPTSLYSGFQESVSKSSLWSVDFPFAEHVDKYLSDSADITMMKDMRVSHLCQMLEVQSLRSSCIARFIEKESSGADKAIADQKALFESEKKKMDVELARLQDKVKALESDLEIAKVNLESLRKDRV